MSIRTRFQVISGLATCSFCYAPSIGSKVYNGIISLDLDKSIPELALNFKGQEYECRLKVIFTPESQTSNADYDYILLDMNEI